MSTIGSIKINMVADATPFNKGVASAKSAVSGFASSVSGLSVGDIFGAQVVQAGVTTIVHGVSALTSAVVSGISSLDDLGDKAAQLGITAGALGELNYIAKLTGSDAESVSMAVAKMSLNLGKAAQASTPAGEAIKAVGLDVKTLINLDPAAAFARIAGAMGNLGTQAEKAAFAQAVFGKGGINILATLGAGESGINALAEEAKALGLSLNDIDASRVGAAQDSIDRFEFATTGLKNALAVSLIPTVNAVSETFLYLSKQVRASEGVLSSAAEKINFLGAGFKYLVMGEGAFVKDMIAGTVAHMTKGGEAAKKFTGELADDGPLAKAKQSAEELVDSLKAEIATFGQGADAAKVYQFGLDGVNAKQVEQIKGLLATKTAMEEAKKKNDDLARSMNSAFENALTPLEKYVNKLDEVDKALELGVIDSDKAGRIRAATELAFDKELQDEEDKKKGKGPMFAGLAELGSAEAYSAVIKHQSGGAGGNDPAKETAKNTKGLLEEQRQTRILMGRFIDQSLGQAVGVFSMG